MDLGSFAAGFIVGCIVGPIIAYAWVWIRINY